MSEKKDIQRFSELRDQIIQAWYNLPVPRIQEAIHPSLPPLYETREIIKYFDGRKLMEVDVEDKHIYGELPFCGGFTDVGCHYYAGVYLVHLLDSIVEQQNEVSFGSQPDINILFWLIKDGSHTIPFNNAQVNVIIEVLQIVADRVDIDSMCEDDIKQLLGAIDYWKTRQLSLKD